MAAPFRRARFTLFAAAFAVFASPAAAQQDFSKVEIKTEKLAENVYMLTGAGGNLGLSTGADGTFLVDDQYAPLTPKIQAAIGAVTDKPVRFVLNTHWHGDHTGGNENLGKAGALIVAHENVRKRMSVEHFFELFNRKVPPSPAAALPVISFTDAVTFHLNGDDIHAFHVAPAHTDGDAVVQFKKANVLHAGDLFFNGGYPVIDSSTNGSIDGMIAASDWMLALVDDKTKIIPGHGPLATKADLKGYRDMLVGIRKAVADLAKAGKTKEEVLAAKPTAPWDAKWGGGFIKPDVITTILYAELSKKK